MPIYMKMDGMKGDATAQGFTDHVELTSFNLGASVAWSSGQTSRSRGTPQVTEISVTKEYDGATEFLLKELLMGTGNKKATVSFVAASGNTLDKYLEYDLEDVGVANYSVSSGGEFPIEAWTFSFTKIAPRWTGRNDVQKTTPGGFSYDLATKVVA